MCDQNHSHTHGMTKFQQEQKEAEDKIIHELVHRENTCVADVLIALRKIRKPVDVYDHNKSFKKLLSDKGLHLVWGIKASHEFLHAYNMTEYTVLTDKDLDKFELSAFIWKNYDLFQDEY